MEVIDNYLNHSLNNSTAKAAYSFPKSNRLQKFEKNASSKFYDLPSVRSKRATSMGYGNKINLAQGSISPPPNRYNIKSQFEREKNNSAIVFGKSRDQIKFGSFLESIDRAKNLPSPNTYKITHSFSKKGGRIGQRLKTDMDYMTSKKTPGPGSYNPKHLNLSDSGLFFMSNLKNQRVPRYHNPQNAHKTSRTKFKQLGPASYDTSSNQFGKSILSKFKNSITGSFSKSQRNSLIDKEKLKVPGPKYSIFSQFGNKKI